MYGGARGIAPRILDLGVTEVSGQLQGPTASGYEPRKLAPAVTFIRLRFYVILLSGVPRIVLTELFRGFPQLQVNADSTMRHPCTSQQGKVVPVLN
jgi:hypothetical protein